MVRRRVIAVMVVGVLFLMNEVAWGAEYWVHPDGNDSNPGTEEEPFRTIQHAIDQCTSANNDTIRVQDDPCEADDYVTPPIDVTRNKVELIFEEGVEVVARSIYDPNDPNDPNSFLYEYACLFQAWSKSNIIFEG